MAEQHTYFCSDCNEPKRQHIHTWLEELFSHAPRWNIPGLERFADWWFAAVVERLLVRLGFAQWNNRIALERLQLRSACFVEEARKRDVPVAALEGPNGPTHHFRITVNGKMFRFDGLPLAEHALVSAISLTDKARTRIALKNGGFPVADGKAFWLWNRNAARQYVEHMLGFPVVVKPRNGFLCRHVTTNVQTAKELAAAIHHALEYSPSFLVERYVRGNVYRATVIDAQTVACVQYIAANVLGDGVKTIRTLVKEKNDSPERGLPPSKRHVLYKIVVNSMTDRLLREHDKTLDSIPPLGQRVWLQRDPFQALGGNVVEVTESVHPENAELFRSVARYAHAGIIGIDLICQDISRSWRNQQCAILELSDVPCIELHQFPSSGTPHKLGAAILNMVYKYYR